MTKAEEQAAYDAGKHSLSIVWPPDSDVPEDTATITDAATPIVFVGGPVRWLALVLDAQPLRVLAVGAERLADVRVEAEPLQDVTIKAERHS